MYEANLDWHHPVSEIRFGRYPAFSALFFLHDLHEHIRNPGTEAGLAGGLCKQIQYLEVYIALCRVLNLLASLI